MVIDNPSQPQIQKSIYLVTLASTRLKASLQNNHHYRYVILMYIIRRIIHWLWFRLFCQIFGQGLYSANCI